MRENTSTGGKLTTFMALNFPKFLLLFLKSIYVSGKEGKALASEEVVNFLIRLT
jgi:hypothetical protein